MGYQCSFAERMVSRTGLPRDDQESTKTLVVQQVAAAGIAIVPYVVLVL